MPRKTLKCSYKINSVGKVTTLGGMGTEISGRSLSSWFGTALDHWTSHGDHGALTLTWLLYPGSIRQNIVPTWHDHSTLVLMGGAWLWLQAMAHQGIWSCMYQCWEIGKALKKGYQLLKDSFMDSHSVDTLIDSMWNDLMTTKKHPRQVYEACYEWGVLILASFHSHLQFSYI